MSEYAYIRLSSPITKHHSVRARGARASPRISAGAALDPTNRDRTAPRRAGFKLVDRS